MDNIKNILNSKKRIDWHDFNYILYEKERKGLGEGGTKAVLPDHDLAEAQNISDIFGYNGFLSDRISLNRSVKDIRPIG